ncbi:MULTISPECIES: ATP-dependent Clp protease ATP-binding subunit [Lactobacillus]|uniref:ATP-dependent Clp protease ATP-binding subunit n=1 Tax=Lactobacillus TaxID=1578 RepID=UPI001C69F1E0|nr:MULTISPECIES: ATP-dependent Clp protease ATP-binding subunit [Lactobacillus]MCX8720563.1 ATP-dependent Clp protease ATP-binding subunit [Lactobacillus sp. B4010]MCX8724586.1 ATP-dependent Clp protease ATP-binding subunit [Lactobacillus sp. B4007]MCX8731414.1 ATP-dependent Clp protease ATP-binding subunit [Lactobacillus sp. B4015]MCX8733635.1 ATP-dependent Clp protease ATP-binding subunit [Lactobacillus sp. B4012]QYN57154.1 ATP-dependent Clp protease ATP-binding subunit [Lactobacillus panisa
MKKSYTRSANQVLEIAREQAQSFHHRLIGTEHVLLAMVIESDGEAGKNLRAWGATPTAIREEIERYTGYGSAGKTTYMEMSPRLSMVLAYAGTLAEREGSSKIKTCHILLGLVLNDQILASTILRNLNIDLSGLRNDLFHSLGADYDSIEDNDQPDNGNGWSNFNGPELNSQSNSNSSTPTLDQVSVNLNERAENGEIDPVIGRDREVARVIEILSRRNKNNPVLIGEPGVGKTAVAEAIATAIVNKKVPHDLMDKQVVSLDLGGLVAGTKYRGEFEDRMKKIIKEITEDGTIILFVDEMHTLIGAGGAEGSIDAANILKPSLARGDIQMIGATTFDEYQKYVEKDQALARRFQIVRLNEPSRTETKAILSGLKPKYEKFHHVKITDSAIENAIDLSSRYISNRYLPDKAIDLIDEASAAVKIKSGKGSNNQLIQINEQIKKVIEQKNEAAVNQNFVKAAQLQDRQNSLQLRQDQLSNRLDQATSKKSTVQPEDVAKVVSNWTGVPVTQMNRDETKHLANLESDLHKRIIGQDKAVSAVSRAVRRSRSGIKDENRPIGSFLFLGPTGVGKTELAKAIAASIFGSENNLIRIDMSEYMDQIANSKLIGSAPGYVGYDEGGQLSEQVRRHPYSVVLLDEVEKAHPDVFNLLLQVLDDGFLTDSKGRKVDFKNTIVIMTSNLGSRSLFETKEVGFTADNSSQIEMRKDRVRQALKQFFRPEFLNRIDETIIFDELDQKQLRQIVTLLTRKLINRLNKQGVQLKISRAALDKIAKDGYNPEMGARPLRRAIQKDIEDEIASMLIKGDLKEGDLLKIGCNHNKLKFDIVKANDKSLVGSK